jgi:hypothetical protein
MVHASVTVPARERFRPAASPSLVHQRHLHRDRHSDPSVGRNGVPAPFRELQLQERFIRPVVVAGQSKAQHGGCGTINGLGNYGFLLTANDRGNSNDKFRIKIWDKTTNAIMYDNNYGAGDDADPATTIAGGSIVNPRSSFRRVRDSEGPAASGPFMR